MRRRSDGGMMRQVMTNPSFVPAGVVRESMKLILNRIVPILVLGCSPALSGDPAPAELRVSPAMLHLDRPEAAQQLRITRQHEGRWLDVTREARFEAQAPAVVRIDADGLLHPLADGNTTLVIGHAGTTLNVPVSVTGLQHPVPISFSNEIVPILTKARCNSGGCHGKAEGQNGFKLSLLGFDGPFDYDALLGEGRGRRIDMAAPQQSLLVRKATATVPHGGGRKIEPGTAHDRRLMRWIASGAPRESPHERRVVAIEVDPPQQVLRPGEAFQLRVDAIDSAGGRRCVTVEADYISNASHIVAADRHGLLQASAIPGEAAILVRFLEHVAVCRVVSPRSGAGIVRPPENNFVDRHVWDKLSQLGIPPSAAVDDATFLRRVSLDTIGTLPTAADARRFLTDANPEKRRRLVDELLARPEYADYWAMKWGDLLRADKNRITPQGTVGLMRWLRKQFAENRPYDELVREILTAQGPVQSESPAAFFKAVDQPELAGRSFSQLFLGVRIECAQCHHHPSERWGQDDFAGLVGFFTGVSAKPLPDGTQAIVARAGADAKHPRTGELVAARGLGMKPADFTGTTDRRQALAAWVVDAENPYFARAIVNRLWAHYFGRGLVEPIDDLRATNPATNAPLLDALAAHLLDVRYDLRAVTRTLLLSRAYQLGPETNDLNRDDRQNFSHSVPKALPAEVLLDAVCHATGVPEKFNGWPLGTRSIQVWDNRMPSYFFRVFGRPVRATVCECERSNEPSISQALHLLNSPEINDKIAARTGTARRLAGSTHSPDEIIDELYLGTLARFPTADERALTIQTFDAAGNQRQQAAEDILWAILNTKEFLYNN